MNEDWTMSEEKTINEQELEKVSGGINQDENDFNEKWSAFVTTHCGVCDQHGNGTAKCDPGQELAHAAWAAGQEVKCPNYTPVA